MTTTLATLPVISPLTGEVIADVPVTPSEEVLARINGVTDAAAAWRELGPEGRAAQVTAAVERALPHVDELATLQSQEMGQPWTIARETTEQGLLGLSAAMTEATSYQFTRTLQESPALTEVLRVPRGAAALITPWNFPLPVALGGLSTLLAGGNTVVWKPAESSPLSAQRLVELLALPDGVLSLVLGGADTGRLLTQHPDIAVGSFTGSVEVGREVAQAFASRFCPVLLELGGKDPVVVDSDVDPVWAAEVVAHGAMWNSGQVCTSMERVYVHRDVAEPFLAHLGSTAKGLSVGDPLEASTDLGPLASREQRDRVHAQVQDAVSSGAQILTGGQIPPGPGWFYPPTVVIGANRGTDLHEVETFGPVVSVCVVDSFEDGVREAASSDYALGATVLTGNDAHAALAATIPSALVWVNEWRGGAAGMVCEPARVSGQGVLGTLDGVTRPVMVHRAPLPLSALP